MNSNLGISPSSMLDHLFASTSTSQDQLDSLANNALSRGIDRFTKKDYDGAAKEFRKSIGLSPTSDNTAKAYDYLSKSYLQQNRTDDAIKILKTASNVFPTADNFHLSLGDLYFKNQKIKETEAEYSKAVKLNPNSADNRYSLGEIYLATDRLSEAKEQFKIVTQLAPASPTGFYGLGEVARKSGDFNNAELQLKKAATMNKEFDNAFLELGYTYADMGQMDKAQKQLEILQNLNASQQVASLRSYMAKAANPKIATAFSTDGFKTYSGPGTTVFELDSSLSSQSSSKNFAMNFIFSKDMDKNSVENIANWQIAQQAGALISSTYNFGMLTPSTEVSLPSKPINVVYNSNSNTAIVTFKISQNAYGNGTIDPSHVIFKFMGEDTYGKTMDPSADEYSGFSKIV